MTATELQSNLHKYNPIDLLAPLSQHKVPILHLCGDTDTVVPLEKNSKELARRYKALGTDMEISIIPGKGHEMAPEYYQSQKLLDFLLSHGLSPDNSKSN